MPYHLDNYRFQMTFGSGETDVWALFGEVYGRRPLFFDGELIHVSVPIKLEENTVTTRSGSQYILLNCAGNEEETKAEIRRVIAEGAYRAY